jgi:two-component system cell cycle response regulator
LVVEDDRSSRTALADLLRDAGYEVTCAADGAEALDRLQTDRPDLVISDVCMRGTDGFEMTRELRARTEVADTRLILVSALGDVDRRVKALDLGADDFLTKPLDPEELLARVRAQLRRARKHSDVVRMSLVDGLTGVLNRRGAFAEIERAIEHTRREGRPLSVLVADVDDFKEINDTLGHATGDGVLKSVADRLRHEVRAADCVGRLGGDEFVVVLAGIGKREAKAIADRIRTVEGPSRAHRVGVSIGAATLRSGESCDALLERADRRMYECKRRRRHARRPKPRAGPAPRSSTTYGVHRHDDGPSAPTRRSGS